MTTQLGYGCSTLMGALGMKESLHLLEAAYKAGIRRYDVAPMYGFGQAEGCVGAFRQLHLDVTVATKYGIPPAMNQGLLSLARRIAGPLVRRFPAMKKRLSRAATAVSTPTEAAAFTAAEAQTSLERSLRELRTERVELWLLHEVEAENLTDACGGKEPTMLPGSPTSAAFSTRLARTLDRVRQNASVAGDASPAEPALRLLELVRREGPGLLHGEGAGLP